MLLNFINVSTEIPPRMDHRDKTIALVASVHGHGLAKTSHLSLPRHLWGRDCIEANRTPIGFSLVNESSIFFRGRLAVVCREVKCSIVQKDGNMFWNIKI